MTAPQAAGVIHSDFERGFIRAETVMVKSTNTRSLYEQCFLVVYTFYQVTTKVSNLFDSVFSEYILVSYSLLYAV